MRKNILPYPPVLPNLLREFDRHPIRLTQTLNPQRETFDVTLKLIINAKKSPRLRRDSWYH